MNCESKAPFHEAPLTSLTPKFIHEMNDMELRAVIDSARKHREGMFFGKRNAKVEAEEKAKRKAKRHEAEQFEMTLYESEKELDPVERTVPVSIIELPTPDNFLDWVKQQAVATVRKKKL